MSEGISLGHGMGKEIGHPREFTEGDDFESTETQRNAPTKDSLSHLTGSAQSCLTSFQPALFPSLPSLIDVLLHHSPAQPLLFFSDVAVRGPASGGGNEEGSATPPVP